MQTALRLAIYTCSYVLVGARATAAEAQFTGIPSDTQLYDTTLEAEAAYQREFAYVNMLRWPSKAVLERTPNVVVSSQLQPLLLGFPLTRLRAEWIPHDMGTRIVVFADPGSGAEIAMARWTVRGSAIQYAKSMDSVILVRPPESVRLRTPAEAVDYVVRSYCNQEAMPHDSMQIDVDEDTATGECQRGILTFAKGGPAWRLTWFSDGHLVSLRDTVYPAGAIVHLPDLSGKTVAERTEMARARDYRGFTFARWSDSLGIPAGSNRPDPGLLPAAPGEGEERHEPAAHASADIARGARVPSNDRLESKGNVSIDSRLLAEPAAAVHKPGESAASGGQQEGGHGTSGPWSRLTGAVAAGLAVGVAVGGWLLLRRRQGREP